MDALIESLQTIKDIFFDVGHMVEAFPIILAAFPVSVFIGVGSFFLGIPGGLLLAFMKMSRRRPIRWMATFYIDVVRGTPLFLQILIVYFGLTLLPFYQTLIKEVPAVKEPLLFGMDATIYLRAFFVLSLNSAAYMAEIFRAGIQSIPKGQTEAARSLGMSTPQAMTFVIIPQTIRRILPTLMSEFILLFKDTSMLAAVGVAEMTMRSRQYVASTFNQSAYMVAAGFYLLLTIPLGRLVGRLEDRLAESEGGGGGKRPPTIDAPAIDAEHVVAHSDLIPLNQRQTGR
ncbi:MAG: amino acid ABC transporter permease [Coriobacteriia bacterium]|nr:amino acid ABC transporter permease [Coriobacteriia bacterium]